MHRLPSWSGSHEPASPTKCGKNIVVTYWATDAFLLADLLANYSIRGRMRPDSETYSRLKMPDFPHQTGRAPTRANTSHRIIGPGCTVKARRYSRVNASGREGQVRIVPPPRISLAVFIDGPQMVLRLTVIVHPHGPPDLVAPAGIAAPKPPSPISRDNSSSAATRFSVDG